MFGIKSLPIAIFVLIACLLYGATGYAGTWTDNFSDGVLNGWTQHVKEKRDAGGQEWQTTWEIKDQALYVSLYVGDPGPFGVRAHVVDFLHFTAFPFHSSQLTVSISWATRSGISQLALGTTPAAYYSFGRTVGMGIKTGLDGGGFQTFAGQYPIDKEGFFKEYADAPLEQIKVVFDSGRFQVLSEDKLLMEFVDEQFPEISVVGILAGPRDGSGSDILDNFQVSGPDIPDGSGDGMAVTARNKLATTWGQVKHDSTLF